jgi:hypothetical protein
MSLPYFPMYPTDFEAKTSHLTLAEGGAYNRLLRICWMTPGCTIPVDETWIMRRVRAHTDDDKAAVRAILAEFFDVENGRYSNAMLDVWVNDARKAEKRPWVPLAVQRFVHERDGATCQYCGCKDGPFHLDHIVPWAMGGEHSPENLTVACAQCNWSKGSKTLEEWRGF